MDEQMIVWLIGLLVVSVIVSGAILPAIATGATNIDVVGTSTAEQWNGTASTAHTTAHYPIVAISDFRLSNFTSGYNDTAIRGNSTANNTTTVTFSLTTPIDTGSVSARRMNVTVTNEIVNAQTNITVSVNGVSQGNVTSAITTFSNLAVVNPTTVTIKLVGNGSNEYSSNVTNITIGYSYFAANTNYSAVINTGQITPTVSGTFYTTYTYGNAQSVSTKLLVSLLALVVVVVLLLMMMKTSGVF